jgi:hypothetical protein
MRAYNTAAGAFRKATTDEERNAAVKGLDEFPKKFLDLADANPSDAIALQALRQAVQAVNSVDSLAQHAWEMNRRAFPAGSRGGNAERAVLILLRDHLTSEKLGPVCDRMGYGVRKEYETFLRAAVEGNPHRTVQGLAALSLAQLLNNHLHMLDLARDRPELAPRYEFMFATDYLQTIRGRGRRELAAQVEARYEQAAAYTDVKLPYGGTVAEKAESELYDLRRLSLGKLAPEIEGKDQDGEPLKLSQSRGKVVLLYFWLEF